MVLKTGFLAAALCSAVFSVFAQPSPALAQISTEDVAVSPKSPWGEFTVVEDGAGSAPAVESNRQPVWAKILLWIPNRVMDAVDMVRVDVGAGVSAGAVARFSKYGQVGYRQMSPFSLRAGLFGRRPPVMVETSNEFGIGPGYVNSKDRKVCPGEFGLGLDFLLGGYIGICTEEMVDFAAGLFFVDVMDDDIK
ncbi:MAG: hypothetical protein K1X83_14930 [Oligoflexia bacterium]|nr:hypothetical protein [Oligoflexia bacterium]